MQPWRESSTASHTSSSCSRAKGTTTRASVVSSTRSCGPTRSLRPKLHNHACLSAPEPPPPAPHPSPTPAQPTRNQHLHTSHSSTRGHSPLQRTGHLLSVCSLLKSGFHFLIWVLLHN
ncbi:hypothetical protein ANANG_G00041410 [Anguilla anguilla]|uniref:Uncharacterized protein n=1 Tax=Anguilla anguilla TaxID=7936 RepID=A0A9D3MXG3_ANGAN|nr:hypothetical protein ANANG_G00041410 [Anguilla anguilla]